MSTTKLQFWAWCFLFVLWVAGCTVEFKPMGQSAPGTPEATLVPCVTVTTVLTATAPANAISPITGTVPLTGTPVAIITATVSTPATQPLTATVTTPAAKPITATRTVTATVAPTVTLRPTRPVTATLTPGAPMTATRVISATTQPTPLPGTRTPASLPSPTATKAPGAAPPVPTPTPAATNTPLPTSTATPTRAAIATATATTTRSATTATPSTPVATPTSGTPAPTPTPPPANTVYVRSHSSFTRDGTLYVVGEVVNGTAGAIFKVRVTANFFNNNDQIVATQEGLAYLAQTSPDQRNPFKLHVENAPSDITRYELSLQWDDVSVLSYQDFTVISQELRQNDGPSIAGELRNDFTENLGSAVVVISLYDAGGNVVDVYQSTPRATQLAPNEVSVYEVPVSTAPPFTTFLVQGQGKRAIFF